MKINCLCDNIPFLDVLLSNTQGEALRRDDGYCL